MGEFGTSAMKMQLSPEARVDRAADELMRACMGGGADIFATEGPRYLDFLKTRAEL